MTTLGVLPLAMIGMWVVIIIALVVLLLFGGKKIPELMKGLGKGVWFAGKHRTSTGTYVPVIGE